MELCAGFCGLQFEIVAFFGGNAVHLAAEVLEFAGGHGELLINCIVILIRIVMKQIQVFDMTLSAISHT
ncbi:MAG: hypothetical protein NWR87_04570, partial [Rhodospirillales bacterium]|nr:hypothetical protein [Rhodospirillales bacterium]